MKSSFDQMVADEKRLEVLHDDRANRQFRDIEQISLVLGTLALDKPCDGNQLPSLVRIWSKKLSAHAHWVSDPQPMFACHHSRYVRAYAEALSLTGCLSADYRDFAVTQLVAAIERIDAKNEQSDPNAQVYRKNIAERLAHVRELEVFAVELPRWPSPGELAAKIRGHRKHGLFSDVPDVLAAVQESRER